VGITSPNVSCPRNVARGRDNKNRYKFRRAEKRAKFGAISDNFRLWSRIYPERIKLSTIWKRLISNQPRSLLRSPKKNVVNFGPLMTEFTRLMLTDPKWTLRMLCRLMQLHSPGGDATSGISTPYIVAPVGVTAPAASRWALFQILSLIISGL